MKQLVALLSCGAILWAGCSRGEPAVPEAGAAAPGSGWVVKPPNSPMLERLRVEPAATSTMAVAAITAPARVEADPMRLSRVALPMPGRVVSLEVRAGDFVRRGQPLLRLESPEGEAAVTALRQSQAAQRQAESVLRQARANLERLTDLLEAGAVAQKDVIAAETEVAYAEAALEQAAAERRQAERALEILGLAPGEAGQRLTLLAPQKGRVLKVGVAPGDFLTEIAEPVMTIADLSTVWMVADIPENQIRFVNRGDRATVTLTAFPEEEFRGRVVRVSDVLDPETRTMRLYVELPNPQGRFRPEMFARVRLEGEEREVPVVPVGAAVYHGGRTLVFVEHERGRFEPREVTVGQRVGGRVPVLRGLRAGERVVVDGAMLLLGH